MAVYTAPLGFFFKFLNILNRALNNIYCHIIEFIVFSKKVTGQSQSVT
jgi:hypothetical protein